MNLSLGRCVVLDSDQLALIALLNPRISKRYPLKLRHSRMMGGGFTRDAGHAAVGRWNPTFPGADAMMPCCC